MKNKLTKEQKDIFQNTRAMCAAVMVDFAGHYTNEHVKSEHDAEIIQKFAKEASESLETLEVLSEEKFTTSAKKKKENKREFNQKNVDTEEEAAEERAHALETEKEAAHKLIDELEGSFVVLAVEYDENHPMKVTGSHGLIRVIGGVHDMIELVDAAENMGKDILDSAINDLPTKEKLHFAKHMIEKTLNKESK